MLCVLTHLEAGRRAEPSLGCSRPFSPRLGFFTCVEGIEAAPLTPPACPPHDSLSLSGKPGEVVPILPSHCILALGWTRGNQKPGKAGGYAVSLRNRKLSLVGSSLAPA